MFIDNKRLKLYDTSIELCINHKTKEKLRRIAYRKKTTMSEYIRTLIKLALSCEELASLKVKDEISNKDINKLISLLGGNPNG